MSKAILKNQQQLLNTLPVPQLGSKYTKLASRLTTKVSRASNPNLFKKSPSQSQYSSFIENVQPHNEKRKYGPKSQCCLQQSQLEYFKQINNQIKIENLNLKQDLKICQQKLQKLSQQKMRSEQRMLTYHKKVVKSEKKISSLMQFAQQLIVMVKDRYMDQERVSSTVSNELLENNKSMNSFVEPLQMKKMGLEKSIDRSKQSRNSNVRPSALKKKTIDTMMEQNKAEVQKQARNLKKAKKSTFFQLSNNQYITDFDNRLKTTQKLISHYEDLQLQQKERQVSIFGSKKSTEKDAKSIIVLKKLVEDIVRTFNQETQTDSGLFKGNNNNIDATENVISNNEGGIMDFVLQQVGTFFNTLIEGQKNRASPILSMDSFVVNQRVKPTYASQVLYKSIKEIFDHQIYLLESQKMNFLQCKNKRLLKFIYQCSGCEKYEEMFAEIFRILREGFKQIRRKILPQLKNKTDDDLEIIL